jgi:hypothetical protein
MPGTTTKKPKVKKPPEKKEEKVGKMMAIIGEIEEIRFIDDLSELQDQMDMEEYSEMDSIGFCGKNKGGVDVVTDQYHSDKVIAIFQADRKNVITGVKIELEQKYVITRRGK